LAVDPVEGSSVAVRTETKTCKPLALI